MSKSGEVKPGLALLIAEKFPVPSFRQREAQNSPADALRLHFKVRSPLEVSGCDPELSSVFIGISDFCGYIVVDHGSPKLLARCRTTQGKKYEERSEDSWLVHRTPHVAAGVYTKCPRGLSETVLGAEANAGSGATFLD